MDAIGRLVFLPAARPAVPSLLLASLGEMQRSPAAEQAAGIAAGQMIHAVAGATAAGAPSSARPTDAIRPTSPGVAAGPDLWEDTPYKENPWRFVFGPQDREPDGIMHFADLREAETREPVTATAAG
jgi:hypothetical protein